MTRSNTTAYDSSDDGYTHEPYVCEECRGLWDAEALADAEADRERFRIAEAWRIQQRSVAPDPTDTWNRRNAAHTHGAAQESRPPVVLPPDEVTPAPCLRRMIPRAWRPEGNTVMLVTNIWNDVVWLWDVGHTQSHHGVALIASRWLVGDAPRYFPSANTHVSVWHTGDDDSGLAVLHVSGLRPQGWSSGECIWILRWLDGF